MKRFLLIKCLIFIIFTSVTLLGMDNFLIYSGNIIYKIDSETGDTVHTYEKHTENCTGVYVNTDEKIYAAYSDGTFIKFEDESDDSTNIFNFDVGRDIDYFSIDEENQRLYYRSSTRLVKYSISDTTEINISAFSLVDFRAVEFYDDYLLTLTNEYFVKRDTTNFDYDIIYDTGHDDYSAGNITIDSSGFYFGKHSQYYETIYALDFDLNLRWKKRIGFFVNDISVLNDSSLLVLYRETTGTLYLKKINSNTGALIDSTDLSSRYTESNDMYFADGYIYLINKYGERAKTDTIDYSEVWSNSDLISTAYLQKSLTGNYSLDYPSAYNILINNISLDSINTINTIPIDSILKINGIEIIIP